MQYGSVNPALIGLARQNLARFARGTEKRAFVPGGDPSMGGDPSAGGMPPGDPSMGGAPPGGAPPGGDPSMGGAPPPGSDPTAGVQSTGTDIQSLIKNQVQVALQGMMPGGGAGAMGGGGAIKPKIDENVVLLQILKMLAKLCDAQGVSIPASEMVVTPEDLQAMAQGGPGMAAVQDQAKSGGQAGTAGASAIKPIQPIQPASPDLAGGGEKIGQDHRLQRGEAFDTRSFESTMQKAAAIAAIQRQRQRGRHACD